MLSERYGAMFGQYEENGEIIEDEIEDEVAALETALKDAEAEKPRLINRIVSLEEDLYFTIYPEENDELPPKAIEEAVKEEFDTNQVESGDEAAHRFAKLLVASEKREAGLREAIKEAIGGYELIEEVELFLKQALKEHAEDGE